MSILDTLAQYAVQRCEKEKKIMPLTEARTKALSLKKKDRAFEKALSGNRLSFICEVKKASPSKGVIAEDFPYLDIAREYEAAGASAVSVLTEPELFLGDDRYLAEIKQSVSIPVLRKDFTVDEYMIYRAALMGADAVLLICSLLDTETIKEYITICDVLGISALVEAHNEKETESALKAGARIIGVNNRDLRDFSVDIGNSLRLRRLVPDDILFVAESGIRTAGDIKQLEQAGVNAVLIGETLMRAKDKKAELDLLRG